MQICRCRYQHIFLNPVKLSEVWTTKNLDRQLFWTEDVYVMVVQKYYEYFVLYILSRWYASAASSKGSS
jgi:hypothetical protein